MKSPTYPIRKLSVSSAFWRNETDPLLQPLYIMFIISIRICLWERSPQNYWGGKIWPFSSDASEREPVTTAVTKLSKLIET